MGAHEPMSENVKVGETVFVTPEQLKVLARVESDCAWARRLLERCESAVHPNYKDLREEIRGFLKATK